ncbi:MAG TPA: VgrG-related protein [Jatrophihabitans sp.]|nr:VgrG-related protein [Jatrophihabitans sp.]
MSFDGLSPTVSVNGSPLAAGMLEKLVSVRVQRSLRLPGRATLRFADAGYAVSSGGTFGIGKQVDVGVYQAGSLLSGTVTGMSLQQQEGDHPDLMVVVDDAAYKLTRGSKVATYLNMTFSQIVEKLASGAGLQANATASQDVHPYVLQADSDLGFLDELASRLGYDWWVEGSTLHFCPPSSAGPVATLELGKGLQEFSVQASGLLPTEAKVVGWDPATQSSIVGQASSASSDVLPASDFVQPFLGSSSKLGTAPVVTGTLTPLSQNEAAAAGAAYRSRWAAGSVHASGTAEVSDKLKPGAAIKVSNAGPASGTYHLTEVEHRYDRRGFRTQFVAGDRHRTGLADTLNSKPQTSSFSVPGLVVGVVTNVDDPDKAGRVKLKYPAISADIEGPWARIVTLGAGNKRGMVFQPEVNDEVLVAFEGGDPRQPVVLGGLFSGKNVLPEWGVKSGQVQTRRITSRLGHIIELADGTDPANQHVLLQLSTTSHKIRLGADKLEVEVAAGKPVSIKSGSASFEIDASQNVTIKGTKVTIQADTELDLKGNSKVSVASQGQLDLQGSMTSLKGQATTQVEASGALTLKGGMVAIN